jgi:uncharacterized membrane protein YgcG
MKKLILFVFLGCLTYFNAISQNLMDIDKPDSYVMDLEGAFTPEEKADLINLMKDYEDKTSIQFCLATSSDFDFSYSTDLANQWKVGQKGLNNGFVIVFSKTQRHIEYRTGYGLEEFLTDGWLYKYVNTEMIPNYFKNELYYDGLRSFIMACQNQIGFEGYDMLVKNKEQKKAELRAAVSKFFINFLYIVLFLVILAGLGYLIYLLIKKNKEYKQLKTYLINIDYNIVSIYNWIYNSDYILTRELDDKFNLRPNVNKRKNIKNENINYYNDLYHKLDKYKELILNISNKKSIISTLYNSLSELNVKLPDELKNLITTTNIATTDLITKYEKIYVKLLNYKNRITDIRSMCDLLSKSNVKIPNELEKVYLTHNGLSESEINDLYNNLSNYNNLVLNVNKLIKDINNKKTEISKQLTVKYKYCEKSNISEINSILNIIKINNDYTSENLKVLTNINTTINSKYDKFLEKNKLINTITNENIVELKNLYTKYLENKKYLSNAKVGNRFATLKEIDIDYINLLSTYLSNIVNYLNIDYFENAVKSYTTYISEKTKIVNEFNAVNNLCVNCKNSISYVAENKLKLADYISKIEHIINNSGVSINKKSAFNDIKSKISSYMILTVTDIINNAEILKKFISDLYELYSNIKQDIEEEERKEQERKRKREEEERRRRNSYSSYGGGSGGGFSSGGGGGFSGGGSFGGGGGGSSW